MDNPFNYTGIVKGDGFCNRQKEHKEMMALIKGGQNILVYSHRRYGKTSLIFSLDNKLKRSRPKIKLLYVDLYGTLSEKDFINAVTSALSQIESKIDKLIDLIKGVLQNVNVSLSVDSLTGNPSLKVGFDTGYTEFAMDNILGLLANISKKQQLAVVFDEFQEIVKYGSEGFEKRLRKNIQHHSNISYIFCGSQRHILTETFTDRNRAFYKLAQSYPLNKIETRHYITWVQKLFEHKDATIEEKIIKNIVERCENHPMYIQQFLYYLWDVKEITIETIGNIESKILRRSSNEFMNLWESLRLNQKKTLKLLIITEGRNIYRAASFQAVDLNNNAQIKRALDALVYKDIVAKNGTYKIQDIMFKKWLVAMLMRRTR